MAITRNAIGIVIISVLIYLIQQNLYTRLPLHTDGEVIDNRYKRVFDAFKYYLTITVALSLLSKNFEDGWEHDGAALAVYQHGKILVDIWGGYADKEAARKWNKDTITVTFSTAKSIAALCIAMLVDKKRLSYDDLVTKYWPAFGKHSKGNITIQMILSHTAGLAYTDETITPEMAADHNAMRILFENEHPKWPPGTKTGYHVYNYGWLVDQLIRASDERKRGIGQFFREEIAQKFDVDYFIGLPSKEQHRVARISRATPWNCIEEAFTDLHVLKSLRMYLWLFTDTMLRRAVSNPDWLQAIFHITLNNPDYQRLEQAAALGIGNARSLGKVFSLISSNQLFSKTTLKRINRVIVNETDILLNERIAKGNGMFFFDVHRAGTKYAFGHTGHGCQQITYDPVNDLTIAYVTNGLKIGLYKHCRTYARLHQAVYDVLENVPLSAS
ncbi:unnamed protein product [Anisakis simplex]|uniref:Beta-lactamase domain-containing protein n=1 Tax=Anisakis simplex TaxID=6269 RepID=A0A0M3JZS9_ANISI|nr:unnamed protein product [Anisakis simplex]